MQPSQIALEHFHTLARVRLFEERLLALFAAGKVNGTTHTCLGQEAVALTVMEALDLEKDCVFSHHRGHGHFLCYGGSESALLAEIMGRQGGICGGLGGSQHLQFRNYYSNGIQGSIVPVATGMALAEKLRGEGAIVCCFIGDGTLGQGVLYEAFNMASLWGLPIFFALEWNHWAQSTPTAQTIAGDIAARAAAFHMACATHKISNVAESVAQVRQAVAYVRAESRPFLQIFDTFRLGAHSKGDDERPPADIERKRLEDPYELLKDRLGKTHAADIESTLSHQLDATIAEVLDRDAATFDPKVYRHYEAFPTTIGKRPSLLYASAHQGMRQVQALNGALRSALAADTRVHILGEDLVDPYGGAFKVTKGLSTDYPTRVHSSPISEAGLTGIGLGMAIRGWRPIVEIMFGDFITLCFDQLVNGASKFPAMFAGNVAAPLLMRTPMGGRRGYGPTHSQSLEKLLLGIPGLSILALSLRHNPEELIRRALFDQLRTTVLIETKVDYGRDIGKALPPGYELSEGSEVVEFASLWLRPNCGASTVTIVTYGGMVWEVEEALTDLQLKYEIQADVCVVTDLSKPPIEAIVESLQQTHRLLTIEEGGAVAGFGSLIGSAVFERLGNLGVSFQRLAGADVPLAASRHLEMSQVPQAADIISTVMRMNGPT